jgi:methylated-DNA-protein-cysteine methyltransferase-like protein
VRGRRRDSRRKILTGDLRKFRSLISALRTKEGAACECHNIEVARRIKPSPKIERQLLKNSLRPDDARDRAFREVIRSIPKGKVVTYGQVAAAAGYPMYHRAVARLLRMALPDRLPWQRVVGAGGHIKLRNEAGAEQRLRLEMEGVTFRGKRVNLEAHGFEIHPWEFR